MKSKLLTFLPHVVAVVVFIIISNAYFSPVFKGYNLRQGDIDAYMAMSKELRDYKEITDTRTLWINNEFSGMPSYQAHTVSEGNWIRNVSKVIKLGMKGPIGTLFMAMFGFYILMLCMKVKPWVGVIGSVGFGLMSIFILYLGAGHITKMNALSYMAPVLGGLVLTLRGKYLLGGAVTALFLSLHIAQNHLQMTYYLIFLLLFSGISIGIILLINGKASQLMKATGVLLLAALLGVLPTMSNLLTTMEYGKQTMRGKTELTISADGEEKDRAEGLNKDYILEYNLGAGELFSIVVPNVKGGKSARISENKSVYRSIKSSSKKNLGNMNAYFGSQSFTGGAIYFGAILVLLAFMGFFTVKNPIKWGLLAVIILAFILALKDYGAIGDFFINKVPLFSKFRDSKMMLVIAQIAVPIMAMLFLDELFKSKDKLKQIKLPAIIGGSIFTLFFLISYLSPTLFFDFDGVQYAELYQSFLQGFKGDEGAASKLMDDLIEVRISVFKADAGRSLALILITFGLILSFLFFKFNKFIILPILFIMVVVDMIQIDQRYLNSDKKGSTYTHYEKSTVRKYPFKVSEADLSILNNEKKYITDFDAQYKELYEKNIEDLERREVKKNKDLIENAAKFGVLGLNSNYRVLKLASITQDSKTSFFHKSLGGYHGAKLGKYQDIIDFYLNNEINTIGAPLGQIGAETDPNIQNNMYRQYLTQLTDETPITNMLNANYIIINDNSAIPNPNAQGNAWFVDKIKIVPDANTEIKTLGSTNLLTEAIVDERFSELVLLESSTDPESFIKMTQYQPDKISYESNSAVKKSAIFSEIYYKDGWIALIDGVEAPIFRANYLLRGLTIPEGKHKIEFIFSPSSFKTGVILGNIGSTLLLLLILVALYIEGKKVLEEKKKITYSDFKQKV